MSIGMGGAEARTACSISHTQIFQPSTITCSRLRTLTPMNFLVGGVMSGTVIGLSSLVIMGLPALLTGAAFGYVAERLTRKPAQLP